MFKNARLGLKQVLLFFFAIIALAVFAHFQNNINNNEETKLEMSIFLMKLNETQNKMTSKLIQ